jgi:hypothetical protein
MGLGQDLILKDAQNSWNGTFVLLIKTVTERSFCGSMQYLSNVEDGSAKWRFDVLLLQYPGVGKQN